MKTTRVLQTNITETTVKEVANILNTSSETRVAICNANTLVRCCKNSQLKDVVDNFTIKTPDGFPVAKALSFLSKQKFSRVDGYKVFLQTIEEGISKSKKHYFFGNNEKTTTLMIENLVKMFPEIIISGYHCPEFMTADELVFNNKETIKELDADIIWVSLGFPKQELFIDQLYNEIKPKANIVGVGAVFEWMSGEKRKAPEWMANLGLEWFLRLIQDPKRLYKRYFIDNTLFILYFLRQVFFRK
jgi:N-acetylglucosaminyldiphosphoundecaprenol N-acetyl-beta-D-mannosaminyltransferase|tara:strand:- start:1144 stop:1878 length:735 start_codon:yes stop_codon:yes gene_type:complete